MITAYAYPPVHLVAHKPFDMKTLCAVVVSTPNNFLSHRINISSRTMQKDLPKPAEHFMFGWLAYSKATSLASHRGVHFELPSHVMSCIRHVMHAPGLDGARSCRNSLRGLHEAAEFFSCHAPCQKRDSSASADASARKPELRLLVLFTIPLAG